MSIFKWSNRAMITDDTFDWDAWLEENPDDVVTAKVKQACMIGCNDSEICRQARISKDTLSKYKTKFPVFADQIEAWRKQISIGAKAVIAQKIIHDKDLDTAKWLLEKTSDEYNPKVRTENIHTMNHPVINFMVERAKPEELPTAEDKPKELTDGSGSN